MTVSTCGIDLAKNVFAVYDVDIHGRPVYASSYADTGYGSILCRNGTLPYKNGSLRECPFLGAQVDRAWPHRQANATLIRQALRQEEQA